MRGLANVRAEFSLTALAYNLRRALNILGVEVMTAAVAAEAVPIRARGPPQRSRSDGQIGRSGRNSFLPSRPLNAQFKFPHGLQEVKADELATTVSNVDLVNYILSNFKTVDEVRQAMPKIRVVRNAEIEKEFGTPLPLHHIVSDATGASIVIEYMDGQLSVTDNKVGAMTNSPGYDWHLLNLRNYANLTPQAARPHEHRWRFARALWSGKRHARIAGRLHAALALRKSGRLRQHHDPGQGRGRRRQRRIGDAQQFRHSEGTGARRREPRTSISATRNGRSSPT